jgi:cytochrome b
MLHWLLALTFAGAYITADSEHWRLLHVNFGYAFAGVFIFRVLYGIFGPDHARLARLRRRLSGLNPWLRESRGARARMSVHWRQGQNLLAALAIVALLGLVTPLVLSGLGAYNDWGSALGGDWLEDAHEFLGNLFLAVVTGHIGLIVVMSLLRRQNRALPMLTGQLHEPGPSLVRHDRAWLAALLLLAVVSFGLWQWTHAPQDGQSPVSAIRERH